MEVMARHLRQFWRAEEAQTLTEYSLILGMFIMALFSIFGELGPSIRGLWSQGSSQLSSANTFSS